MAWTNWWRMPAGRPSAESRPASETMHGIGHTALVHLALPSLERGVPRPSSSPTGSCCGSTGRRSRPAGRCISVEAGRVEVGQPDVVDRPLRSPLGAGAVVRHHDDDGVVELAQVSRKSRTRRPIWASVWERKPAKHSMNRAATVRRARSSRSVPRRHPRRPGREPVPGGTPRGRAAGRRSRSRQASHPSSKRPR